MTADPADLAARMIEAAARALFDRRDSCGEIKRPDDWDVRASEIQRNTYRDKARAALAAAVREAGLDAEDLLDVAAYIQGVVRARREYERRHESTPCEVAVTTTIDRTAAMLRALGGIADAG